MQTQKSAARASKGEGLSLFVGAVDWVISMQAWTIWSENDRVIVVSFASVDGFELLRELL